MNLISPIVRVGILKFGCLGSLPLIEFLIDERADRADVEVIVSGSGSKLKVKQCIVAAEFIISQKPDFVVLVGPAQHATGPSEARRKLVAAGIPTIVISDGPARGLVSELEKSGLGYIIIGVDAMIGARREFLDPVEMALFNSDIIRVLAITGVIQIIVKELDDLIRSMKYEGRLNLPRLIVDKELAIKHSGLTNPYARAKAMACYEVAERVAKVDSEACFKIKERNRYVPLVASAHEMMRAAARLADEAREIDKGVDCVVRKPHYPDGTVGFKTKLIEKPQKPRFEDK